MKQSFPHSTFHGNSILLTHDPEPTCIQQNDWLRPLRLSRCDLTVGDRAKTLSPPDACFSTLALALLWLLLGSWLALNSLSRLAG